MVLTFESVNETLVCVTIQMKAIEQYFQVVFYSILNLALLGVKQKGLNNALPKIYVLCMLFSVVVESMSKSAFLDMLKSSSDKARTQDINDEQKMKVLIL